MQVSESSRKEAQIKRFAIKNGIGNERNKKLLSNNIYLIENYLVRL